MIARWHEATKDWRQCVDATPSRHSRPTNSTYTQTQYTQTQYTQTHYTHTLRDGRWRHTRPGLTLMTRLHSLRPPELLQRSTLVNSGQLWSTLVSLVKSGQLWSTLVNSGQVWSSLTDTTRAVQYNIDRLEPSHAARTWSLENADTCIYKWRHI